MAKLRNMRRSDVVFVAVLYTVLALFFIIELYPMLYVVSASFSAPQAVTSGEMVLWPVRPSLDGYRYILQYGEIWSGYANTLFYTVVGTLLNLAVTLPAAYAVSRRDMKGAAGLMLFYMFTMYFSGGLVPSYILVNSLHLTNTRWAMIIPSAMSTYNMIICRTYMTNSIPDEMYEAAQIDGCTPWKYFLSIVTPLCKPILAVLTLYYGVAKWNDYYTAMIYLRDDTLMPLTIVMKEILIQNKIDMTQIGNASNLAKLQGMSELLKYSTIVVASVPVMLLYPLVQKHLVKGVMIGAVKG